jgi:hypothetical protein
MKQLTIQTPELSQLLQENAHLQAQVTELQGAMTALVEKQRVLNHEHAIELRDMKDYGDQQKARADDNTFLMQKMSRLILDIGEKVPLSKLVRSAMDLNLELHINMHKKLIQELPTKPKDPFKKARKRA